MKVKVPLSGLGLTTVAMYELVNRLNKADPRGKWVLENLQYIPYMDQLQNPFIYHGYDVIKKAP